MTSKRHVLDQLKRDELIAAVERFELPVADRRVRNLLIDALASSRKATLAEILGALKRARLKELCRALGLDDGGREKAVIIERLAGKAPAARPEPRPRQKKRGRPPKATRSAPAAARAADAPNHKMEDCGAPPTSCAPTRSSSLRNTRCRCSA